MADLTLVLSWCDEDQTRAGQANRVAIEPIPTILFKQGGIYT